MSTTKKWIRAGIGAVAVTGVLIAARSRSSAEEEPDSEVAVYITDGKETMAITVAITGRPKIWKSHGGHRWVSL